MLDKTNLLFALLHVRPLSVFTIGFGRLLFVPGGLLSSFYHSIFFSFHYYPLSFFLFSSFCTVIRVPFVESLHLTWWVIRSCQNVAWRKDNLHYFFSIFLAIPLKTEGVSFRAMEYSPLLGGFAVVLADGRGGFLSADTASFECSVSMIYSDSMWLAILNFLCVSVNWSHCIHLCRCYHVLSTNAEHAELPVCKVFAFVISRKYLSVVIFQFLLWDCFK